MLWLVKEISWTASKNDLRTYDNIRRIATDQGDD